MQIANSFTEREGHTTVILDPGSDLRELKGSVIEVLEEVWIGNTIYDDDIEEYIEALSEFDLDLEQELRSRGQDQPFTDKKDRLVKDRGDVAEVLGYLRETQIRGIPPAEMFVPLIWAKLKGGLTTHGLDGIGFIWASGNQPDTMILCEWKHTPNTTSVQAPCSSAADEWNTVTYRKLMQELRRVRRIYLDRSEIDRAERTKWFAYYWLRRDPSVVCTTMITCPDIMPIQKARESISVHLVQKCAQHTSNPTNPGMHEVNLLPLPDMIDFLDGCHREFIFGN